MAYFRDLWTDTRKVLSGSPDLLAISAITALVMVAPYYLPLRIPGLDLKWAGVVKASWTGLLYLVLPLLSLTILRLRPSDAGISLGRPKVWLRDIGLLFLLMLPLVLFAAHQPSFRRMYPALPIARLGPGYFALAVAARLFLMTGWEFLCRGYVLFGFARRIGGPAAVAVQTIPFVVLHVGKPLPETLGAIIAGVALGILALRSRSFVPCVVLHWAVASTLDLFAVLRV
jgi:membrane protease YdiL (CAAX protease family)